MESESNCNYNSLAFQLVKNWLGLPLIDLVIGDVDDAKLRNLKATGQNHSKGLIPKSIKRKIEISHCWNKFNYPCQPLTGQVVFDQLETFDSFDGLQILEDIDHFSVR